LRTLAWAKTPPAAAAVAVEPPRVREKELTGGTSPSATFREGRQAGSARGPAWAKAKWAGHRSTVMFFLFLFFKNCFIFEFV